MGDRQGLEYNTKRTYKDITKEKLYELYVERGMTKKECGEYYNCSPRTIYSRLNKFFDDYKFLKYKYSFEEFMKENYPDYKLLSEYKSRRDQIKLKHLECGNKFQYTVDNIHEIHNDENREFLCPECHEESKRKERAKEFFKKAIKREDINEYTFLSKYHNNKTNIEVKHKCGNKYSVQPHHFLEGTSCPKCAVIERGNNRTKTQEEFQKEFDIVSEGNYTLESKYIKDREYILVKHECGNRYEVLATNFLQGKGCPKCSLSTSDKEKEILELIKKNYEKEIVVNDRDLLNGKEIDIYLPEDNIAFEYNGLYWHSEAMGIGRNYHSSKTKALLEKDIHLIHILGDEWNNNKELVKNKILYLINALDIESIYARKCYAKEIDSKVKGEFLNKYHIQGADRSNIKLGLFSKDSDLLLGVMTFSKLRKSLGQSHKEDHWELSRFAINHNYIVPGGFGKLFKHFIRNYDYEEIITYADRRWSLGDVYKQNGFELDHISKPNYWYVKNDNIRKHRFNFAKHKLEEKFPDIYYEDKSETEIMEETNYYRLWDCGNYVFKYFN